MNENGIEKIRKDKRHFYGTIKEKEVYDDTIL